MALPRGSQGRKRVSLGGYQARGNPGYIFLLFPLALPWQFARHPVLTRRGGPVCPPFSLSRQPPDKAQANLGGQTFRQLPRGLNQTHNCGARPTQPSGPARAGRMATKNGGTDSEDLRFKPTCAKAQVRRPAIFLLDRSRPVLFLSRTKREWGVDCPASNLATSPLHLEGVLFYHSRLL